ncbi:hypothetical protein [Mycobacterium sp. SMC-4]|uniref:hypothetical protein n=1 Tax=Mycobacterium sp. SMC-4 TaxID=2857059 RepID=UPI0021B270D0|nr:hypothetical protein [Mycobacterium sp. SMC-4]UXA19273.1 hypothetical protein KXD98_06505 [Mycobacterium sp. SMC-4]
MAKNTANRIGKKLGMGSVIALAAFGTLAAVGAATANADVIRPNPGVQSNQAQNGIGVVKNNSTHGDVRGSDLLEVNAHGDVRQSMIAVPGRVAGTRADSFNGTWHTGIRGGLR